jgi:hypothetical protein
VLGGTLAGLLRVAPRDRPTARQVLAALDAAGSPAGPSPARDRGWWWAAAGAVAGLLIGIAAGFALAAPRIEALTYGPDGDVRLAGTAACLDAAPAVGAVIGAADCSGPHGAEVVASLDPSAERYPGGDVLVRLAAGACPPAFDVAVERPRRAGLELVALVPTRAAFDAGERVVLCVARPPAKPG